MMAVGEIDESVALCSECEVRVLCFALDESRESISSDMERMEVEFNQSSKLMNSPQARNAFSPFLMKRHNGTRKLHKKSKDNTKNGHKDR